MYTGVQTLFVTLQLSILADMVSFTIFDHMLGCVCSTSIFLQKSTTCKDKQGRCHYYLSSCTGSMFKLQLCMDKLLHTLEVFNVFVLWVL